VTALARRGFLRGAVGAAIGLGSRRALAQADRVLTIAYEDAGQPIAADFVGLSYESAILAAADYFAPDNASVLGLIRTLGANGVIRIGGNTSTDTVWRGPSRTPADLIITPRSIDQLATALRSIGWKLIYGLNLARGMPEEAAAEAVYVAGALGANLLAFQIGNEPDGFGPWMHVRPERYDAAAYLAEWRTFHAAIRARLPDARFAGPDVAAATDWVAAFAAARPEGLALLTHHHYVEGPAGSPDVTLARLLHADPQPLLEQLARLGSAYRLPYRIAEVNSVYDEGQPGVSDTLGAALWGLEFMFEAAAAGAAGVNFHAGVHNRRPAEDKAYTPIARNGGGRHRARPLYYGMLMFAQAARGALLPTQLESGAGDLQAFAVRASEGGGLRVCLINKEGARSVRVRIDTGRFFATASVMRLLGPALDAVEDMTLGGSSVDAFGRWTPVADATTPTAGREVTVDVPAASAALVMLS
jgi:hypothetical protein